MRHPSKEMCATDDRILEYLDNNGVALPYSIARHPGIKASEPSVKERLRYLAALDLVGVSHSWLVELTIWGRLYLQGEIDVSAHRPESLPTISQA